MNCRFTLRNTCAFIFTAAVLHACQTKSNEKDDHNLPLGYVHFTGKIADREVNGDMILTGRGVRGNYTDNQGNVYQLVSFNMDTLLSDNIFLLSESFLTGKEGADTVKLKYVGGKFVGDFVHQGGAQADKVEWKTGINQKGVALTYKSISDSLIIEDKHGAFYRSDYLVPDATAKNNAFSDWLMKFSLREYTPEGMTIDAAQKQISDVYISDFREAMKEVLQDEADGFYHRNYQFMHNRVMNVLYNDNNMVSVSNYIFDFSGGAHPMHSTYVSNYDLDQQKELKWNDVFAVSKEDLQDLMEKRIRVARNIPADSALNSILFEPILLPNDNFFILDNGIGFWYNPYDIAPYVYGDTILFFTYAELKQYLKTEFLRKMGF